MVEPGPSEPGPLPGQVRAAGLRAVLERAEAALGTEASGGARLDMYREFLRMEEKRLEEQARVGTPGLELAHRRVRSVDDIALVAGLPVLATVPPAGGPPGLRGPTRRLGFAGGAAA